ncbi:putative cuticle protein [Operophtera brumata]|uniref:Putative cuticle protein n=1 Tax=Operophtera brumata TaxID=104452 RepID=A0A0L7L8Q3_OPEBR|nr:putative cuticle protein [Operophtera brumata]
MNREMQEASTVVIAAFIAVCGAAKLDRTYLPPSSAATAGGSPGSLQAPLTRSSEQGLETPSLPTGSYTNNFGGVVVDAASPGTRASADADLSGLGGPRPSYGSSNSKVGDAAFRGSLAGFRNTPSFVAGSDQISTHGKGTSASNGQFEHHAEQSLSSDQIDTHAGQFSSNGQVEHRQIGQAGQGFSSNGQAAIKTGQSFLGFDENKSERPQAAKDRNSNILTLSNDVNSDSYSYGFETDNGIAVGENGVAVNGVQAEGGYSYQGDDGQVYKVTYTADEGGYRPQGAHLPTPPPIPEEILKSLEQNAKEEAAGLVDDGKIHQYN